MTSGVQTCGCGKEQCLLWTGAGQQQSHAPGVAQQHRVTVGSDRTGKTGFHFAPPTAC